MRKKAFQIFFVEHGSVSSSEDCAALSCIKVWEYHSIHSYLWHKKEKLELVSTTWNHVNDSTLVQIVPSGIKSSGMLEYL